MSTPASRELLGRTTAGESGEGTTPTPSFPSGFCWCKGEESEGNSAFKMGLVAKLGRSGRSSGVGERGEFKDSLSVSFLSGKLITSSAMDGL